MMKVHLHIAALRNVLLNGKEKGGGTGGGAESESVTLKGLCHLLASSSTSALSDRLGGGFLGEDSGVEEDLHHQDVLAEGRVFEIGRASATRTTRPTKDTTKSTMVQVFEISNEMN